MNLNEAQTRDVDSTQQAAWMRLVLFRETWSHSVSRTKRSTMDDDPSPSLILKPTKVFRRRSSSYTAPTASGTTPWAPHASRCFGYQETASTREPRARSASPTVLHHLPVTTDSEDEPLVKVSTDSPTQKNGDDDLPLDQLATDYTPLTQLTRQSSQSGAKIPNTESNCSIGLPGQSKPIITQKGSDDLIQKTRETKRSIGPRGQSKRARTKRTMERWDNMTFILLWCRLMWNRKMPAWHRLSFELRNRILRGIVRERERAGTWHYDEALDVD